MPQTTLYARTGEAIGTVELSEELFAAPVNAAVLHQVAVSYTHLTLPTKRIV